MSFLSGSVLIFVLVIYCQVEGQQELSISELEECEETVYGCSCLKNWEFRTASFLPSETYRGCNNPDNDPNGLWCMVDLDTCDTNNTELVLKQRIALEGSLSNEIGYYDRCFEGCPEESGFPEFLDECVTGCQALFGCSCKPQWSFGFGFAEQILSYCENPDSDPGGKWCKIDETKPCEFDQLERLDMLTRDPDTEEILSYWAYCSLDCGGLVRPEIFMDNTQSSVQQASASLGSSTSGVSNSVSSTGSASSGSASSGASFGLQSTSSSSASASSGSSSGAFMGSG